MESFTNLDLSGLSTQELNATVALAVAAGTLYCFLGYRTLRFVLAMTGFLLAGMVAGMLAGWITQGHLISMGIAAALVGAIVAELPTGGPIVLCHGDLHPGNVVLTDDGPMLVDWFDAGRGDPLADVARSTLLIAPDADGAAAPAHLIGGDLALRRRLVGAFLAARGDLDEERLARWRAVMAIARIAEGVASSGLDGLWHGWAQRRSVATTG